MKNKHLLQALDFAKRLGCIVTRKHFNGMTAVTVTDATGNQCAAKVYKTGSSNPQAVFIKSAAKGFKLVETGVIVKRSDGSAFFLSEKYNVLYRWHPAHKEWRVWMGEYDGTAERLRIIFAGNWCNAKVNVNKLRSGVKYYDDERL